MTFVPEIAAPLTRGSSASPGVNEPGRRQEDDANVIAFYPGEARMAGETWDDVSPTLKVGSGLGISSPPAIAYPVAVRGRDDGSAVELGEPEVYNALRAGDGGSSRANYVLIDDVAAVSENQRGEVRETDYTYSVTSGGGKPGQGYPAVRVGAAVRRLTPRECERLQGFPDDWTALGADNKRYAALGDAVTVNVAEWIGKRLVEHGL